MCIYEYFATALYCTLITSFSVFLKLHSYFSDECINSETFVFCNLSKIQKINVYKADHVGCLFSFVSVEHWDCGFEVQSGHRGMWYVCCVSSVLCVAGGVTADRNPVQGVSPNLLQDFENRSPGPPLTHKIRLRLLLLLLYNIQSLCVALHCLVWWKSILMRGAERNILKQKIGGTVANNVIRNFTICRPVLQVMLSRDYGECPTHGGKYLSSKT